MKTPKFKTVSFKLFGLLITVGLRKDTPQPLLNKEGVGAWPRAKVELFVDISELLKR